MQKSLLYARRVKGDLEPALEPARIDVDGNRSWAYETFPGGRLPGQPEQGIYEVSSTKKYRIGTRRLMDERVFRYTKVGDPEYTGLLPANSGFRRGIAVVSENCLTEVAFAKIITCTAGEKKVTLNMDAAVDFMGAAVTVAEDEYEGGYFTFSDSSSGTYWGCKILSNTAEDDDGYVTFSLEEALPVTAAAGDIANVCQNPWWKINMANGATNGPYSPYVGVFINYNIKAIMNTLVNPGDFVWVQTWGPLPGPIMGRGYGIESCERMLLGHVDGTFTMPPQAAVNETNQVLGWFMNCNYNGGAPYDMSHPHVPVIFLMIAP